MSTEAVPVAVDVSEGVSVMVTDAVPVATDVLAGGAAPSVVGGSNPSAGVSVVVGRSGVCVPRVGVTSISFGAGVPCLVGSGVGVLVGVLGPTKTTRLR